MENALIQEKKKKKKLKYYHHMIDRKYGYCSDGYI